MKTVEIATAGKIALFGRTCKLALTVRNLLHCHVIKMVKFLRLVNVRRRDTQHNDNLHSGTQHNRMVSIVMLSVIMMSVECYYAECHLLSVIY